MGASFGCSSNGRKAPVVARAPRTAILESGTKQPSAARKGGRRLDANSGRLAGGCDFGLRCLARQRIVGAIIERADAVAVETLLFNLEIRAEQQLRRQLLDRKTDRLRGGRKALVPDRAARFPA